jgi:hypothetical protein
VKAIAILSPGLIDPVMARGEIAEVAQVALRQ